jgi:uncharacterized protein YqiB (DUF1249 family)
MQTSWHPQLLAALDTRPNVGRLVELCEHNYGLMLRLAPGLRRLRGSCRLGCPGHADLHLEVLEQARYTSLIHLTHYFSHSQGRLPEPDAVLRAYHDARELEVVELRQAGSVLSSAPLYERPGLCNKWKLNDFVGKWLTFCLGSGYRLDPEAPVELLDQEG